MNDWWCMKQKEVKICEFCNKPMEYRKKWRNNWENVKYCSERCRRTSKNKENKQ